MAASVTGNPPKVVEFHKSKFWWFITTALALTLFVYGAARGCVVISGEASESRIQKSPHLIIAEIRPEMPGFQVEVPSGKAFIIDGDYSKLDWLEIRFWSGRRESFRKVDGAWYDARGKMVGKEKPVIWLQKVKAEDKIFWLRGGPPTNLKVMFPD